VKFSESQSKRLVELNAASDDINADFDTKESRDRRFYDIERDLIKAEKERLKELLAAKQLPVNLKCQRDLENWLLNDEGFTQVSTPIIISEEKLSKMNLEEDHHLREQIFWMGKNKCLRPMLAPNLYEVMRDIHKITNEPVRIFEAGPCFRKDSQTSRHLNEFTMLNLVEFASVPDGKQTERIEELAAGAMAAVGLEGYRIVTENSGIYGTTIDIEYNGVEIASGAFGPHPLDANWGVFDTWVGLGIGIERLAMTVGGYQAIKSVARSNNYIDGITLKLK